MGSHNVNGHRNIFSSFFGVPRFKTVPPKQYKIKEMQINITGKIDNWIDYYGHQASVQHPGCEDSKLKTRSKMVPF